MLDPLHQEPLQEDIDDHQRENNHQSAGIVNCGFIKPLPRVIGIQRSGNVAHQFEKRLRFPCREEQAGVELVGPLPAEGEQEDRDQHGHRKRKNDLEEGAEGSRTVNVCRFLQLVGNAAEELTEQEDIKPVLKAQTAKGKHNHRRIGIGQLQSARRQLLPEQRIRQNVDLFKESGNAGPDILNVVPEKLDPAAFEEAENAKHVKIAEAHEHGYLQSLVRDNDGQNDQQENDSPALELELCKSVTYQSANQGLNHRNHQRKDQGIAESAPIAEVRKDCAVNIQRKMFRFNIFLFTHF